MKHWADAEGAFIENTIGRGSEEAMLKKAKPVRPKVLDRLWDRTRSQNSTLTTKEDMTIKQTSELEWRFEEASKHNSPRSP